MPHPIVYKVEKSVSDRPKSDRTTVTNNANPGYAAADGYCSARALAHSLFLHTCLDDSQD